MKPLKNHMTQMLQVICGKPVFWKVQCFQSNVEVNNFILQAQLKPEFLSYTHCLFIHSFIKKKNHSKCHSFKCQESNNGKPLGSMWMDLRHRCRRAQQFWHLQKNILFYLHSTGIPLVNCNGLSICGLRNVLCFIKREKSTSICKFNMPFLQGFLDLHQLILFGEKQRWSYVLGLCICI